MVIETALDEMKKNQLPQRSVHTVQFFHPIITLYNVCSVHRGMFSTSGDVQYIGRCSVHRGDTMSTSGGYHEYIGGIS